ncbi:PLP-dependent aminotransferase family protein [Tepidibacter hydrothermalis]|uniref:PLP-dependent aminotransferase family protein n=1 Tax=Tepidibacter hydrothermalis TaxID=3036126 RepID=A0ABY8EIR0_9FIRM|nr:PLP-dependent aminotransferase family protein [Tepidibacter hydrothermalis]WFD11890.1 PLP-dependent aminotransferase family protein [Tepidibacter hydrothermalis]
MEIHITLKRNISVALYIQIYEAYRSAILSGNLKPNTKLASIMQLKQSLCVSRNTIEMAYLQLLSEGFIYSKSGSGYFVSDLDNYESLDYPNNQSSLEEISIHPIESLHLSRAHAKYDFKPGSVEHNQFPFKKWNRVAQNIMNSENQEILTYSDPRGELLLRIEISKYLKNSRGVNCHPDQIIVGAGTQTLISLFCFILGKKKPLKVAIEDPGFTAVRKAFEWNGCDIMPIRLNNNTLDISMLKSKLDYPCAVYITPSNQHPMGGLLNVSERLNLLNWVKNKDTYIIEDDYDSEFRYNIHPVPTIFSLDQFDKVIYLGTFSKTLFPAMHVGYIVLPNNLAEAFVEIGCYYNQTASKIHQLTIAEFMKRGYFEQHIRKMRTLYAKKHNKIVDAIKNVFGSHAHIIGDHAGVNLALRVNLPYSESELIQKAKEVGVIVYPISFYRSNQKSKNEHNDVFLGYGHMQIEEIEQAITILGEAWL